MPKWTITNTDQGRWVIELPITLKADWHQWVMLRSDAHHDNPHSRHDLERKHLDMALERDAIIIDAGDLFCAMQGRGDPRGHKSAVRPENNNDRYLDSIIESAYEFYRPYAGHWAVQATGNHEASVTLRKETDLIQRWCTLMNMGGSGKIVSVGMRSNVLWRFKGQGACKESLTVRMNIQHGYGGGGPITRDVIQASRKAIYLSDSDIVISGHTHDAWVFPIKRESTTSSGRAVFNHQWHVKTPTYKDEFTPNGWATSKGMPPKPLGCIWLRFRVEREGKEKRRRIAWDFFPDIE